MNLVKNKGKKRVTLEVENDCIVFVTYSDGSHDLFCPETLEKVPKCQVRAILTSIQEFLEVLKDDTCDKCKTKETLIVPTEAF